MTQVTRKQPGLKRFKAAGENLLLEMAAPDGINQVWVADVTYIKVKQKWRYLATVMDVYSRRVIGWSLSERRTTALTEHALTYALKKRAYPKGAVFSGIKSLRKSLRRYINKFYNTVRLHSGIDCLSPVEFERRIA